VGEYLQQHFVDLCGQRPTPHGIAKYSLNSRERRFGIGPLVIDVQKFLTMHHEVSEKPIPRLRFRSRDRIALERYERLRPFQYSQFQIRVGTICFVSHNARNIELVCRLRNQGSEIRRILSIFFRRFDCSDYVGFRAVKLVKSMNAVKVPATVQAILASRIDRLPANEKDLLQALAVIGPGVRVVTGQAGC
jgi:hypothetical protein